MTVSDLIGQFSSALSGVADDVGFIANAFVAVLAAAAVIWLSALAWRKYKESTSKV